MPAVPADQLLIPCEPRGSPFVPFKPGHLPFCFVHILPLLFLFRPLGNPSDPQRRSPSHSPPVPHSPPLKPLPDASTPTHGNLRQPTAPQPFAQPACSAKPTAQTAAQHQLSHTRESPPGSQHRSSSQGSPVPHSPPFSTPDCRRCGKSHAGVLDPVDGVALPVALPHIVRRFGQVQLIEPERHPFLFGLHGGEKTWLPDTAEGQGVGDMFTEPDWNRVSICTIED